MTELIAQLDERIKALGGDWAKYSVVGSFVLYVTGYLVLRFHLTALGVATDLAVLDERYLFAGARFFVYVVAAIPSIVLMALPLVAGAWMLSRLVPRQRQQRFRAALGAPASLVATGVLFSVAVVQFAMRQCFYFSDLLLAPAMPMQPAWLGALLLDDRLMPLYFSGLVAAAGLTSALLWLSWLADVSTPSLRAARALLAVLAAIQWLLLPVNYGMLIVDKSLPRVAGIGDKPIDTGAQAWLAWEGKEGVTYLVRRAQDKQRALLTLPRAEIKRVEVVGFDAILPVLFAAPSAGTK